MEEFVSCKAPKHEHKPETVYLASQQAHLCWLGKNFGDGAAIGRAKVPFPGTRSQACYVWLCSQEGTIQYLYPIAA